MNTHFIKSNEKREIVAQLKEQFGIESLPYLLIESGKEKIRAFSGSLSKEEILKIGELAKVEIIGLYLIKREHDLRLSLDATTILKNQINKNILELTEEQFQKWIRGHDLQLEAPQGTYVIKYKDDFIGCGKSNGKIIFNYVPKDRRIKKP
jgi:NOL1/NOP2/fmu family ribosome biogenesis protein